ncbi:MAG TPA: EutN/CcmL family microcompartment protein [Phycisphaerae bacterium]|nr:EutN/CcmL family microcompartment protein [Phycisphaerae bacterium]
MIGKVTLGVCDPKFIGSRLLIIQPHDPETLRQVGAGKDVPGGGEPLVAWDELGAGLGERVGFSEGREAAMPFHPGRVAVDAYIGCLLDKVTYGDR